MTRTTKFMDPRLRFARWAPAAVSVALFGLHLTTALRVAAPTLHVDEAGYLTIARHLATRDPLPDHQYYPGYSLLIVPVFWLFRDPITAYHVVLLVNAVLVASVGALAWWFVRMIAGQRLPLVVCAGVALVVGLYPSYLVHAGVAWAEALIVPAFLALACLVWRMLTTRSVSSWLSATALAVFLPFANPRVFPVVVAFLLVALASLGPRPGRPGRVAALVAGSVGTAVLAALVLRLLDPEPVGPVPHRDAPTLHSVGRLFARLLEPANVPELIVSFAGQGFYLTVASLGLVPLGMVAAAAATKRAFAGKDDPTDRTLAFAFLSLVGVWLLSALFMSHGPRIDHKIYGRYNEGFIAPLLVVGLLVLLGRWDRGPIRSFTAAVAVVGGATAVTALVLGLGRSPDEIMTTLDANWFMIHALRPPMLWLGGVHVVPLAVGSVLGFGVLWLVGHARRLVALALLAMWFTFVGVHGVNGYLVPDSRTRAGERNVAEAITAVEEKFGVDVRCVGYDATLPRDWHEFNYWYFLPGMRLERFHAARETPCSDLVVGPKEGLDSVVAGARLITLEVSAESALWVYPGALSDRLAEQGWLLPSDLRAPFPDAAYRSRVSLLREVGEVRAGRPVHLLMRVQHAGEGSPWPSGHATPPDTPFVRLGARLWRDGEAVAQVARHLPRTLLPGQWVETEVWLPTRGLAAGTYELELGLVHDGVGRFGDRGDESLRVPVRLR